MVPVIHRGNKLRAARFWLSLTPAFFAPGPAALDWSSSNIQALYGEDFILGEERRATVTLEHAHGWSYGDNFFFADLYHHLKDRGGADLEAYGEWYSVLSLKRTTGLDVALPGVRDVGVSLGVNAGSKPARDNFKAWLGGVRIDLDAPGFEYLQVSFHAYKNDNEANTGLQITPVWSVPFNLGSLHFKFRGFMDVSSGETAAGWHLLAQPQLLFDAGALHGERDKLMLGVEWWCWKNKYGIKGQDESAPQAELVYFF